MKRLKDQSTSMIQCPVCAERAAFLKLARHMREKHSIKIEVPNSVAEMVAGETWYYNYIAVRTARRLRKEEKAQQNGVDLPSDNKQFPELTNMKLTLAEIKRLKIAVVPSVTKADEPFLLPPQGTPLLLFTRRCNITYEPHLCFECKKMSSVSWHFSLSNYNDINLCAECKPKALDRAFGKVDAFDHSVSGGAFEMNRRKH